MAAEAQRCARAIIEYDGTAFAGSQVQPNARTVQGELEEALNRLIGERTRVRLAGRTDAGVHATGQVAAFCLPRALPWSGGLPELRRRLNAVLAAGPGGALRSSCGTAGFDPRRDALWRVYRYRIRTGRRRRPLDRHRTLEIDDRLDVGAMRAAAARHASGSATSRPSAATRTGRRSGTSPRCASRGAATSSRSASRRTRSCGAWCAASWRCSSRSVAAGSRRRRSTEVLDARDGPSTGGRHRPAGSRSSASSTHQPDRQPNDERPTMRHEGASQGKTGEQGT